MRSKRQPPTISPVTFISSRSIEDASGCPALVTIDGYKFSCDVLGEIKICYLAPTHGSHVASRRACEIARREYEKALSSKVDAAWRERNRVLYAD